MSSWGAAASCGALAAAPIVAGVCGFAAHWNVFTNLLLIGAGIVYCATLYTAWRRPK